MVDVALELTSANASLDGRASTAQYQNARISAPIVNFASPLMNVNVSLVMKAMTAPNQLAFNLVYMENVQHQIHAHVKQDGLTQIVPLLFANKLVVTEVSKVCTLDMILLVSTSSKVSQIWTQEIALDPTHVLVQLNGKAMIVEKRCVNNTAELGIALLLIHANVLQTGVGSTVLNLFATKDILNRCLQTQTILPSIGLSTDRVI